MSSQGRFCDRFDPMIHSPVTTCCVAFDESLRTLLSLLTKIEWMFDKVKEFFLFDLFHRDEILLNTNLPSSPSIRYITQDFSSHPLIDQCKFVMPYDSPSFHFPCLLKYLFNSFTLSFLIFLSRAELCFVSNEK